MSGESRVLSSPYDSLRLPDGSRLLNGAVVTVLGVGSTGSCVCRDEHGRDLSVPAHWLAEPESRPASGF
jgi:hypothetical protein